MQMYETIPWKSLEQYKLSYVTLSCLAYFEALVIYISLWCFNDDLLNVSDKSGKLCCLVENIFK